MDKSGSLDADELLAVVAGLNKPDLDLNAINALIREADVNCDGVIQEDEFEALLVTPPAGKANRPPHLVLNFDVNQTVMILDTAIKAEPVALLNSILSNCCWGRIVDAEGTDPPIKFELVSTEPQITSPETGLKTYLQYVVARTPIDKVAPLDAVRAAKAARRTYIQTFTEEGQPGEPLGPHVRRLQAALQIPAEVRTKADAALLERLGLVGGSVLLLPSFLRLIRELKRVGRSFSVCFRTFGKDLLRLMPEFNAMCEGGHPFFLHEAAEPHVILDGTDGAPDMRMAMTPGGPGLGTWIRLGAAGSGEHLLLVLGSIEQPPLERALKGIEEVKRFYAELVPDEGGAAPPVEVIVGATAAADRLRTILHQPGRGTTLALRDYYPGWEALGCRAEGGKPLLLEPMDTADVLQIFFDDHINAHDAHIVDVRRAQTPSAPALPIGAVLGSHLIRAEPLHSIGEPSYFIDAVADAEASWRKACRRRAALAAALRDRGVLIQQLERQTSGATARPSYIAHEQIAAVASAPDVSAAEDDDNA